MQQNIPLVNRIKKNNTHIISKKNSGNLENKITQIHSNDKDTLKIPFLLSKDNKQENCQNIPSINNIGKNITLPENNSQDFPIIYNSQYESESESKNQSESQINSNSQSEIIIYTQFNLENYCDMCGNPGQFHNQLDRCGICYNLLILLSLRIVLKSQYEDYKTFYKNVGKTQTTLDYKLEQFAYEDVKILNLLKKEQINYNIQALKSITCRICFNENSKAINLPCGCSLCSKECLSKYFELTFTYKERESKL